MLTAFARRHSCRLRPAATAMRALHRCWIYEWNHPTWSEIVVALKFLARAEDASRCLRGNAEAENISGRVLSSVPRSVGHSALFHRELQVLSRVMRVLSLYAEIYFHCLPIVLYVGPCAVSAQARQPLQDKTPSCGAGGAYHDRQSGSHAVQAG